MTKYTQINTYEHTHKYTSTIPTDKYTNTIYTHKHTYIQIHKCTNTMPTYKYSSLMSTYKYTNTHIQIYTLMHTQIYKHNTSAQIHKQYTHINTHTNTHIHKVYKHTYSTHIHNVLFRATDGYAGVGDCRLTTLVGHNLLLCVR